MKRFIPVRVSLSACLFSLVAAAGAHAQYTNGQNAVSVLGQSSFTGTAPGTSSSSFRGNSGGANFGLSVVVDNVSGSGKVYVVDTGNNRVLRFSSQYAVINGAAAEAVIGQTTISGTATGSSPANLRNPVGAALDPQGNLWVADTGNNRILKYKNAANLPTISGSAAAQIGQLTGNAGTAGLSQRNLNAPTSVAFDSVGRLYIADRNNHRVLRFSNPSAVAVPTGTSTLNPPAADGLFGQNNFSAGTPGVGPASLNTPYGVAVDSNDNLWVADNGNNRVVRFSSPATASIGASADFVLGQQNLTTGTGGTSQTAMSTPVQVTFDPAGRIYVAEFLNNRVSVFQNAEALGNGAPASFVLGQPNFTSNTAGTTQAIMQFPFSVSYSSAGGYLMVGDYGNNRVLRFTVTPGNPVVRTTPTKPSVTPGVTKNIPVKITNSSGASDAFTVKFITPPKMEGKASFRFSYQGKNITSQVNAGTFQTPLLYPGSSLTIKMATRAFASSRGKLNENVKITSLTNPSSPVSKTITIKIQPK